MARRSLFSVVVTLFALFAILATSGVYAMWRYGSPPLPEEAVIPTSLGTFDYNKLYIINVSSPSSATSYTDGTMQKIADTKVSTDMELGAQDTASVSFDVTFYNGSEITYYYNKTENISYSNSNIVYEVTGIQQKDAIAPQEIKTVTVTFTFANGNAVSNDALAAELNFLFVVDKDSIGIVAAKTILDRFRDILNNIAAPDSYNTLDTAMDSRSGYNKASAVTYIGNVVGSDNADTVALEGLFGEDSMYMDLDGDGEAEPITIMIKREDLDENENTGADYTYTDSRGRSYTVKGAEMSIYITSQNLSSFSRGDDVVVYAATFTKLPGAALWTDLVPLTKGVAPANNYQGGDYYGAANSFNTNKWESDSSQSMADLVYHALND